MHLQYWPIKILQVHRVRWQSFAIWMHSWIVWLYSQLCGGFWTIFSSCLVYWLAWKEIILRDLRRILCHNSCIWACFGQFFFCVCALVCQLAWKKIFCNKMLGGTGSTRGDFYTGTRNESKYEVWENFDSCQYVCIGKLCIYNAHVHINMTIFIQFGHNCSIGCLLHCMALLSSSAMWWFPDNIFLFSVWAPWKKEKTNPAQQCMYWKEKGTFSHWPPHKDPTWWKRMSVPVPLVARSKLTTYANSLPRNVL